MDSISKISIILDTTEKKQIKKAQILAEKLSLPLHFSHDTQAKYHLVYTDYRLHLQQNPHILGGREQPISAEFLFKDKIHRRITTTTITDPLAKAVGIKPGIRPSIIDTTAGLGVDGISLAWLGCQVTLIERSAIIHALLDDGLERAFKSLAFDKRIADRVQLLFGNSIDIFSHNDLTADTVLVDPMYPETGKSPKKKKEMLMLREIVGDDMDSQRLFNASLPIAGKRVVVKRPKGAPLISESSPSHQTRMKSGRFDVYLKVHL